MPNQITFKDCPKKSHERDTSRNSKHRNLPKISKLRVHDKELHSLCVQMRQERCLTKANIAFFGPLTPSG